METMQWSDRSRVAVRRPFFLVMALALAGIALLGFSRTVPQDFVDPDFPLFLGLHGAIFTAWMLLFVAQPALIINGSAALHRRLGWVGAALACAMVALGSAAILFALKNNTLPPFYPPGLFLARGVISLLMFAGLVTASVLRRRRPEWHKRLILCASIVVVVPGLERALPLPLFGDAWPFVVDGVVLAIALAGPAADLLRRGRVHPAYAWGVGAILLGQVSTDLLAPSPATAALVRMVGGGA
jgi:uncharacterized membrane protein YozB (DUF420 family)